MNVDPNALLERYLNDQQAASEAGLDLTWPDGLALPFEDTPFRPLDGRAALQDALAVVAYFPGVPSPGDLPTPPNWVALLHELEPVADVPFGFGQFPQRVRSLARLLKRRASDAVESVEQPELRAWAEEPREALPRLFAAGVLRLAGDFSMAQTLLSRSVPASLKRLRINELAVLSWKRGDREAALAAWQGDEPAVAFNRGLAALFLGRMDTARSALDVACLALPESSAWHHLASLYRAMVELD